MLLIAMKKWASLQRSGEVPTKAVANGGIVPSSDVQILLVSVNSSAATWLMSHASSEQGAVPNAVDAYQK